MNPHDRRASEVEAITWQDPYLASIVEGVEESSESAHRDAGTALDRRRFLVASGWVGGGLLLSFGLRPLPAEANAETGATAEADAASGSGAPGDSGTPKDFAPNGYIRITREGEIFLYAKAPEIGQGVKTSLPMIVAEELDVAWDQVRVEQAPIDPDLYGRQSAGGSRTIPSSFEPLRRAGASARALLIAAAAARWQLDPKACGTEQGQVIHAASKRRLAYGELVEAAAAIDLESVQVPPLKPPSAFKLIGRRIGGVDNLALVTGAALFGIDQQLPGMLHAALVKCPARGGRVKRANLDEIRKLPGVRDCFVVEGNGNPSELMPGVAIVTDSTWAALRARKRLEVSWDESQASKDSWSKSIEQALARRKRPAAETLRATGDIERAFTQATKVVEGFYTYPFVAHAPLEPQNCTAWFRGDSLELWAPTQTPDRALGVLASLMQLPVERVTIHQTRAGGGFGRRLINDPMCEAAWISKRVGAPVKLTWTREEDMCNDFYRVGGFHDLRGAIDAQGRLIAWSDHFITFSYDDKQPVSGGNIAPNEFPALLLKNFSLSQSVLPLRTPCGPWRAPRSNAIAFAVQGFMDELAAAAGRDPVEFWLELLGEPRWLEPGNPYALHTGRAATVIRLAAERAGWNEPLAEGSGRGLAFHFSHAGHFAEIAQVRVGAGKKLVVERVTVAGDIGPVINPSGAENQCEGSVIDGLSTMFGLGLELEAGRISPQNFDGYRLLRMPSAPLVSVHFVASDYPPTGVGEPALPPVAPAICNAIFAATGERVRTLPLTKSGFSL